MANIQSAPSKGVALVTGSSGNLGQAVIKKFIKEGYTVIGTVAPYDQPVLNDPEDRFEKIAVDLLDEAGSALIVESIISKHGSINTAVLTVGGFATGTIASTCTADILQQYKLNFETAYNIARPLFAQMMKQNTGRIFMIGSRPGLDAANGKGMIAYGLGKSLIFRLAELMNDEAMGSNVVTAVVVPGTIDTAANRKAMPGSNFGNWVKAADIADVIHYHCTEQAAALREPIIKVYNHS